MDGESVINNVTVKGSDIFVESVCPVCASATPEDDGTLNNYRIIRCCECGLRFAPDALNAKVDYNEVYDTEGYIRNHVNSLKEIGDPAKFTRFITFRPFFENLYPENGMNKLLDVGCGVGRFCHAAHTQGWDVIGIDVSENAVNMGKTVSKFPLKVTTLEEMAKGSEKFDVLTAFEVLEHISQPLDFIRTALSVLKPGGRLFITVPNWDAPMVRTSDNPDWIPPIHVLFFTKTSLTRLVSEAGLKDLKSGFIFSDPWPDGLRPKLSWIKRRIKGQFSQPSGLWITGRRD